MAKEALIPPRGTRDWIGKEALKRESIIEATQKICKLYGFSPIQTPSIERAEVLEDGYRGNQKPSFFRIMDRGESLQKRYTELINGDTYRADVSPHLERLADMGLRYDLTIPTSRIIERYNLSQFFPLKRYQIGSVWRTDKPSSGRLREFTVCDIDVFGTTSAVDDAEAILIVNDIFESLGIPVEIQVNNRKIVTVTDEKQPSQLIDPADDIDEIEKKYGSNPIAQEGVAELRQVFDILKQSHIKPQTAKFAPDLRRSLTYYIGTIIEARVMGRADLRSPINGGRYNETPGTFANTLIPTVGLSMSLERMQAALGGVSEEIYPNLAPDVLIILDNDKLTGQAFKIATRLRSSGVKTMIYSNRETSLRDQMKFADKNKIRWVALIKDGGIVVKDFTSGEQKYINLFEGEGIDLTYLTQK